MSIKDAEKTFKQNEKSCYRCIICGYDKHIEIAHIKAVSDFADESLISEINHINNIIPLCPNHHWEYDNNAMNENEKRIIEKYMKT